jgi:hypothetical protein
MIAASCFYCQCYLLLLIKLGAGEESRTLDLNLGKVALYQLSYSRFVVINNRQHYRELTLCQGKNFVE